MTREMKIGTAVAGSFLALVGGVVGTKMYKGDIPKNIEAVAELDPKKEPESPGTPKTPGTPNTLQTGFLNSPSDPLPPPTPPGVPPTTPSFPPPPAAPGPNAGEAGFTLPAIPDPSKAANDLNATIREQEAGVGNAIDKTKNDLKVATNNFVGNLPGLPPTAPPAAPPLAPPTIDTSKAPTPPLTFADNTIVGGNRPKEKPAAVDPSIAPPPAPVPGAPNFTGAPPGAPQAIPGPPSTSLPTPPPGTQPGIPPGPPKTIVGSTTPPAPPGIPTIPGPATVGDFPKTPPSTIPEIPSTPPPPPTSDPFNATKPPLTPKTSIDAPTTPIVAPRTGDLPPVVPSVPVTPGGPSVPPIVPPIVPPQAPVSPPSTGNFVPTLPGPPSDLSPPPPPAPPAPTFTPSPSPVTPVPPIAPIVPGTPQVRSDSAKTYTCLGNENYALISVREYGNESYARALEEYNRDFSTADNLRASPAQLKPGTTVLIPPQSTLTNERYGKFLAAAGNLPAVPSTPPRSPLNDIAISPPMPIGSNPQPSVPPRPQTPDAGVTSYRVPMGGMYLAQIAQTQLGSPLRWIDIYRLNPGLQPEQPLREGMEIRVPTK